MQLKVFVGPKGSGKDSCAKILKDYGLVEGKIPFAGPLKQICAEVFDIPIESFEDPKFKEHPQNFLLTPDRIIEIADLMSKYIPQNIFRYYRLRSQFLDSHEGTRLHSARELLQYVGTEMIREYDYDWHCTAAFSVKHDKDAVWAVTDCRFLSEYEYLKKNHDCEFFYIDMPEAEIRLSAATHQSELEVLELRKLIPIENIIRNHGTISELKALILDRFYPK